MDLLAQMATFVRVVEAGSLAAAARVQRLSAPAVSRQIHALETELGARLLLRSTRRLILTEEGERWYRHSVQILRDVQDARAAVGQTSKAPETLTVSAPVTLATALVVPLLPQLLAQHSTLSIDLRLEDHVVDLFSTSIDLAIRAGVSPPDSTAYVALPLVSFHRFVVASPAYLMQHGTPTQPEHLGRHECLVQLGSAGPLGRWVFHKGGVAKTIDVRGRFRTNAPLTLRDLALAGAGVSLLPEWLVEHDIASGRLSRLLASWEGNPATAWVVYRVELRGTRRLRMFVDGMRSMSKIRSYVLSSGESDESFAARE